MPAAPAAVRGMLRAGQAPRLTLDARMSLPDGTSVPVTILDGSIEVDRASIWRRTAKVTLDAATDPDLVRPTGQRIEIRRGVLGSDGSMYYAPMGLFRVVSFERDGARGPWVLEARSLEYEVTRAKFLAPRTLSYRSIIDGITALITEAVPDASVSVLTRTDAFAAGLVVEQDRWEAIDGSDDALARAIGCEVYCAATGGFEIADMVDETGRVDYRLAEGQAIVDHRESGTEEGVYNVIVATGEAPGDGPVPYGIWWDSNPSSPTYVGDVADQILRGDATIDDLIADGIPTAARGFGMSPYFYTSPLLSDMDMAKRAAEALGKVHVGLQKTISFDAALNPWADVRDIVEVLSGGVVETHIIDRLTIPLLGASMSAETRAVPL